ncbi:SIR2 family protein [Paenibacillus sp. B01]|uniref:SIR2 family protein n=1 Tax=Paenibacillus sp. B01 TaxID=2660554 RepID=UPI00129B543F|nr:SIR2 family protein [Paenibacillus sp. B01]QGG55055.1 hypothetical protein GE073_05300 [Paenibacillus sp. B01]
MIDPMISLAFTLHSKKGAYALMLGSGISRSSGIPTGWEITLQLATQAAALDGDEAKDPVNWYRTKFGGDPDYGELLNMLYKAPSERSQFLRGYFEPTPVELERNLKTPTPAHRAIARLVQSGVFRVIITTNFDRLLEKALDEIGVTPTVISNSDSLQGAMPYVHSTCTIIKVHGDYLDTRIKNTGPELETYDESMNILLNRIFDEFGIITCGWSAAWDTALRAVFERCNTHRFTTFWTTVGEMNEQTQRLISLRRAEVIRISSADHFFGTLEEKISALEDLQQPHPLSAKVAVANLKRYIADDRFNIKLHDLVLEEALRAHSLSQESSGSLRESFSNEILARRLAKYETDNSILIELMATGAYWGKPSHSSIWSKAFQIISDTKQHDGLVIWLNLQLYPTLLITYASGIAALASNNLSHLKHILIGTPIPSNRRNGDEYPLCLVASSPRIFEQELGKHIPGLERRRTPVSDHLFNVLREPLMGLIPRDSEYQKLFVRFEYYFALIHADLLERDRGDDRFWGPIGQFGWRYEMDAIQMVLNREIEQLNDKHPLLLANFFDSSIERLLKVKKGIDNIVGNLHWH